MNNVICISKYNAIAIQHTVQSRYVKFSLLEICPRTKNKNQTSHMLKIHTNDVRYYVNDRQ